MTLKVLLRRAIYGFPRFKRDMRKRLTNWLKRPSMEERLRICERGYWAIRHELEALKRQASASCHPAAGAAPDCPPLPRQ